jgi:hypothetical protein
MTAREGWDGRSARTTKATSRGVVDICDADFALGVIEPIRENVILDHEVLYRPSGFVRKRVVAADERLGRKLLCQSHDSTLMALGELE